MSLDLSDYDLVTADTAELLTNVNGAWRELETWAAGHIVDIANLQLSVDNLAVNLEARFVANVNNNNRITQQYGAKIDQHIIDAGYAHGLLGDRITDLEAGGGGASYPEISQVDAEAGTDDTFSVWSAERVGQAITALGGGGVDLSDYQVTWDDPADQTAVKVNATNTQSGSGSLLMDLGVDAASKFIVGLDGSINIGGSSIAYPNFSGSSQKLRLRILGDTITEWARAQAEVRIPTTFSLAWGFTSPDVKLYRDAANTLALRNSTNEQALNIYNTYTDASNYERLGIYWDSNVLTIGAEAAGSGIQRYLELSGGVIRINDTSRTEIGAGGSSTVYVYTSHLGLATPLRLNNTAAAETPAATHTMTIQDSTGTSYKVLCLAA